MQKATPLFLAFVFLVTPSFSWYEGRTDLPDGDAETSCATLAGFDIGRDLSNEFKSDYSKIPKGQWFRIRGQIRRMSYDAPESVLRHDDTQRQGNCYFHADSGMEAEYIQSVPFPRTSPSSPPYNYYFSASMADYDSGIHIQLEWYNEKNELLNTTSIHSSSANNQMDTFRLYQSNEATLGKIVSDAKTMLIRITIDSFTQRSENTQHSIDMISVVFFPDNIQGGGRPGK